MYKKVVLSTLSTCFKYTFMNLIFLPFLSLLIVLSLSVTVKVLVTFVEVLSQFLSFKNRPTKLSILPSVPYEMKKEACACY